MCDIFQKELSGKFIPAKDSYFHYIVDIINNDFALTT